MVKTFTFQNAICKATDIHECFILLAEMIRVYPIR